MEIIAIDIGTASLSAALAKKKGSSGAIEVVSVLRYGMDLFASYEGFNHQRRALHLIKKNIADLMANAYKVFQRAEAIEISVSELFFQERRIRKAIYREHSRNRISREEFNGIASKFTQDAAGENGISSQSLRVARSTMRRAWINGYELKDPIGYRGMELEIEFEVLLVSSALCDYLEELRMRWFPSAALRYHTDPETLEYALFASSSLKFPALLFDIGGEVTSIAVVYDNEARTLCDPVFLGVRTLERRIAELVRCDMAHAESLLRRYVSRSIDAIETARISPLLESTAVEWMTLVAQSFHKTHAGAIRSIFLAGQGRDIPIFRRIIEQRISDFTSFPAGLPERPASSPARTILSGWGRAGLYELAVPLDRLFPPKSLSSGGDSILASLLLYA